MRFVFPCCFLGIFFAVVGCGGTPSATVSGKVYYKGEVLKGGRVSFVSEEKKVSPPISDIDENGNYTVYKVPVGEMTITVDTDSVKPADAKMPTFTNKPPPGANLPPGYKPLDMAEQANRYKEIPAKYKNAKSSPLKYSVKPGKQEHDIKLD
ncbi:MAG: hypothetical protein ACYC3I_05545 [Gemmataceae bacterium]